MKIGILSDSHDNLQKIEKAVSFFNKNKVNLVMHAGDFIAPFAAAKFNKLCCPWQGVFGNNDGERNGLRRISEGRIKAGPLKTKFGGKIIILLHDIKQIKPSDKKADIIIFGHTHIPEVTRDKDRLLVNPGECGGWLTGSSTLALLDTASFSVKIVKI